MRVILILILVIRELQGHHPSDIVSDDSDLERMSDQELSFLSNEVDKVQSDTPTLTKAVNNRFSKKRFLCFPPRVCILPVPLPHEVTTTKPVCPTPAPTSPPNDFMNDIVLDVGPLTFIFPRDKAVTWLDAYAQCTNRKSFTLVSIKSVEKYTAVIQAITKSGIKSRDFWTSGTDVFNLPRNASNFVWLPTEEPVELTLPFWTRDQPDNGSKGQQCLTLSTFLNGVDFKLDDQECSRSNTFICERLNN